LEEPPLEPSLARKTISSRDCIKLAPREREHAGLLPKLEKESGDVELIGDSPGELDAAELAEWIGDSSVPGDTEQDVPGNLGAHPFSVFTESAPGLPNAGWICVGVAAFCCQLPIWTAAGICTRGVAECCRSCTWSCEGAGTEGCLSSAVLLAGSSGAGLRPAANAKA